MNMRNNRPTKKLGEASASLNSKSKMQKLKSQEIFCKECGFPKESEFCNQCQKETKNHRILECESGNHHLFGQPVRFGIKRGEISWAYFPIAYGILLTISVGVIQLIEYFIWYYRVILILIVAFIWLYLCFFNRKFKEFIISFFARSKEMVHWK